MSKFKQNDRVIITHPSRAGQRGRITGVFSGGYGVHIDGTGRGRAFYYDVDMEHELGNPPMHGEEAMDHGNASWQSDLPKESIHHKFEVGDYVGIVDEDHALFPAWGYVESIHEAGCAAPYRVKLNGAGGTADFEEIHLEVVVPYTARKREDRPAEMKKFRTDDPLLMARELVHRIFYGEIGLPLEDVYIVWFCSALGNWKALISTNVLDNAYYEVTHNGEKNETYVDRYIKEINANVNHETGITSMTVVTHIGF